MKKRICQVSSVWIISFLLIDAVLIFHIPCWIYELTGLLCPSCGTTRLIYSLIEGNFHQAIQYNIFMIAAIPLLFLLSVFSSFLYIRTGRFLQTRMERIALFLLVIAAIIYMVIRNLV